MHITLISIFPELFQQFISSPLIGKSVASGRLQFSIVNPRDFCTDKQKKVDDEIYGGGVGLLMKAEPIIQAIQSKILECKMQNATCKIILVGPSKSIFNQKIAHDLSDYDHLIFICGRYEGIDHRVKLWCQNEFGDDFCEISLGKFVTL
jgi:tRNA (guanine37-N1)-methyltransferase